MQDKNTTSNQTTDGSLTSEQKARYARHLMLPQVGESGQEKINSTSVLVVGAGGLGSPVLMYLAAAGIGRIGIVDDDFVDIPGAACLDYWILNSKGGPDSEGTITILDDVAPGIYTLF